MDKRNGFSELFYSPLFKYKRIPKKDLEQFFKMRDSNKNEDRGFLKELEDNIVLSHVKLMIRPIYQMKIKNPWLDVGDLFAVSFNALYHSLKKYNINHSSKCKYSTYALNCIHRALNSVRSRKKKKEERISNLEKSDFDCLPKPDSDNYFKSDVEREDFKRKVFASLIDKKERRVIEGLFFLNKKLRELGSEMGYSTENIRRIREKALAHLRESLLDYLY